MLDNRFSNLAEIEISYKTNVKPWERPKITSSQHAYEILNKVWNHDNMEYFEECIVLCLNRANQVLGWKKISQGGVGGTVIDVRIVLQIALKANASGIILAHNHPSGTLETSDSDLRVTSKIKAAADFMDIKVLDHIIITSDGFYSFADEGRL